MTPAKSMAESVWRDLTPVGRWTIGVPLVVMVYATIVLIVPFVVVLFLLVKCGAITLLDRTADGIKGLFFKDASK